MPSPRKASPAEQATNGPVHAGMNGSGLAGLPPLGAPQLAAAEALAAALHLVNQHRTDLATVRSVCNTP